MSEENHSMEVDIKEIGPCQKAVTVTVPAEAVDREFQKNYSELGGSIDIPGFRKGRAPKRLLQRRFGKQIEGEVKQTLIGDSFRQAFEENDLQPVMLPELDPESVVCEEGQSMTFEATVEVRPEIELGEYKGLEVEKQSVEVGEEDIANTLDRLRSERAEEVSAPEDGAVERGDTLRVDLKIESEGESKTSENIHVRVLPEGAEQGNHDFPPEAFVGKHRGDVVTGELPAHSHGDHEHAVQVFEAKIHDIKRDKKPDLDDAFASEFGFDSLDDLRSKIEEDLAQAKENEEEKAVLDRLIDQLIDAHSFELPAKYVESETEASLNRLLSTLQRAGFGPEEIGKKREELLESQQEHTVRELKKTLLLDSVAEAEGLYPSEEDVDVAFEQMAASRGRWASEMRQEGNEDELRENLRSDLTARKAGEFLVENAKIVEAAPATKKKSTKKTTKKSTKKTTKKSTKKKSTKKTKKE